MQLQKQEAQQAVQVIEANPLAGLLEKPVASIATPSNEFADALVEAAQPQTQAMIWWCDQCHCQVEEQNNRFRHPSSNYWAENDGSYVQIPEFRASDSKS